MSQTWYLSFKEVWWKRVQEGVKKIECVITKRYAVIWDVLWTINIAIAQIWGLFIWIEITFIIGSNNGMSLMWYQAITWNIVVLLSPKRPINLISLSLSLFLSSVSVKYSVQLVAV